MIEYAEGFGRGFAVAWQELHRVQVGHESSVGALMEHMNENVLERSDSVNITVTKKMSVNVLRAA